MIVYSARPPAEMITLCSLNKAWHEKMVSLVDSVMIASNYDSEVFNITLANVPERKNDLVEGKYSVEAKKGTTIAVKVMGVLGEELLAVNEV